MSIEDETYDIDLYGDDPEEDVLDLPIEAPPQQQDRKVDTQPQSQSQLQPPPAQPSQGLKRKAADEEHDEWPLDAGAQISLKLTELQWWTTEEDLRFFAAQAKVEQELVEIAFAEHKINGKSKGDAYLEFRTPQAAGLTKRAIEKTNAELESGGKSNPNKSKIQVWYTAPGNPFRVREGAKKEVPIGKYGQGAYNNYNSNPRGNFSGRGRGGYSSRGGGQWSGQNSAPPQNNFGYGNMGFNGNAGMMNPMAMMMAAGGFMGMPNMMARGGGNQMMGRGGWNAGQAGQQGYQSGNKKSRTE